MFKHITTIITGIIATFLFVGIALASSLSVRVEQPKSPTNQNDFNLTFVALDMQNNPVTVTCFKKGPSDGSFSQFDTAKTLSAGGNTDSCHVTSSVINTDGTYSFYVSATNGTDTVVSQTVTVDVNTSGPGTPTNYSKDHPTSCQYVIKFHTADDSGKTAKVELYRSDSTTFSADSSTRVQSVSIGSNTDGTFTDNVPDCSKTYYYAIRAFDTAGNGSGVVGDSEVHITNPTTTTQGSTTGAGAQSTGGAIPVVTSSVTQGEQPSVSPSQTETNTTENKQVLGAKTSPWNIILTNAVWVVLGLGLLVALWIFIKLRTKKTSY